MINQILKRKQITLKKKKKKKPDTSELLKKTLKNIKKLKLKAK